MKKDKTTVYEERAKKREARMARHIVACPHCGADVLDHMTKCPHCGGELVPKGYRPIPEAKMKKIKIVTYSVGAVLAVAVIVLLIVFRPR